MGTTKNRVSPKNQFIPIQPKMLSWVRIELGLSLKQAAEKTKFSTSDLQNWESGTSGITLSQGKKLADKYKVSLPFLYLKQTPKKHKFKSLVDFRAESKKNVFSDRLCLAIQKAHHRQVWMRDFLIDEGHEKLAWLGKFSQQKDPDNIAQQCKAWLVIKQRDIAKLKDNKAALSYWIAKVEAQGVIVASNDTHFAYKIDREEYSGLVLYDDYAPLILLNPQDSPARRIFTLIHELAHLLIKQESSVSLVDFRMKLKI